MDMQKIYDFLCYENTPKLFVNKYGEENYNFYAQKKLSEDNFSKVSELKDTARNALIDDDMKTAFGAYAEVLDHVINDAEAIFWFLFIRLSVNISEVDSIYHLLYPKMIYAFSSINDEDQKKAIAKIMFAKLATVSKKAIEFQASRGYAIQGRHMIAVYKKMCADSEPDGLFKSHVLCNDPQMALQLWKDAIALRYDYTPFRSIEDNHDETWYDITINKIKKVDPKYIAPKFLKHGLFTLFTKGLRPEKGD